jgi:capsular exopolysaccharide synthesis family protein
MDSSVKKPRDLHARLNLPDLGSIPDIQALPVFAPPSKSALTRTPGMEQLGRVALETWNNRTGEAARAYRSVLTSLLFAGRTGQSPQVIVVTSATRGEGKTALVSNLAAALAQMKQSVLLVDASDNRKLQQAFGQSSNYGIWDVLEMHSEHAGLLPYITNETFIPGVSLVVIGPTGTSVLDLLHSDGLGSMLQQMRRSYDVILIDAPAVEERPDARVFARLSDGVVLVVRAGETTLEAAQTVAARLQEDGSLLLGTVLNHRR